MIIIDTDNIEDLINTYNNSLLNSNFDDYLLHQLKFVNKDKIIVHFNKTFKKSDQELITNTIHNYYLDKYKKHSFIDKFDDYVHMILLILGIIFILISEKLISFLSELFLIAGWVVVWEIIYDLLFNSIKKKKLKNSYKKLANCEITFNWLTKVKYNDKILK